MTVVRSAPRQRSKRPVASLLSISIGAAAIVALFWQFGVDELAATLRRIDPLLLASSVAVGGLVRLGYVLRWRATAAVIGVHVPVSRFAQARLAGDALGAVLPTGRISGDPLRVALLRNPGHSTTTAATSVALDRFMEWVGNTFCAIGYVTVFALSRGANDGATWAFELTLLVVLGALVVPLVMLRLGWRPFQPLHHLESFLPAVRSRRWFALLYDTETELIEFFRHHSRVFMAGTLVSLVIELMILVEYRLHLSAFGIDLGWPTLMMVVVTGGLARSIPIPAGLGVLEASQVGLLAIAAGDGGLGFLVGIVVRLHEAFWTLVGFGALASSGGAARLRLLNSAGKASA